MTGACLLIDIQGAGYAAIFSSRISEGWRNPLLTVPVSSLLYHLRR
jgi:hypothetical protein